MQRCRTALATIAIVLAASACGTQSIHAAAAHPTAVPARPTVTHHPTPRPVVSHHPTPTATPAPTSAAPATTAAATPSLVPTSSKPTPTATDPAHPHFDTPEAAMRYLATAWNTGNMTDLKHVTQGTARELLLGMHREAVNLRLNYCALRPGGNGDYLCHFIHDYPSWYPQKLRQGIHGSSEFIAAPSSSVGWYMFAYQSCG